MYRTALLFSLLLGCQPEPIGQRLAHSQLENRSSDTIDFGQVRIGRDSIETVDFANTGAAVLFYGLTLEGPGDFRLLQAGGFLEPGESVSAEVRVFPTQGPGMLTAGLRVRDQREDQEFVIALVAEVPSDADGDGFVGVEFGGDDCDDGDPDVHPGALENWYDGVDQNCDNANDFDRDGDGYERSPDGADCDDLDASVHPGAMDSADLVDNDCDGFVDEDDLESGDALLNEWFIAPDARSYIEIANHSGRTLDLGGWVFDVNGTGWAFPAGFQLESEGLAVLCADSGAQVSWTCDADFEGAETLGVAGGVMALELPGVVILDSVKWGADWEVQAGAAQERRQECDSPALSLDASCWCQSRSDLEDGMRGTPGEPNSCNPESAP